MYLNVVKQNQANIMLYSINRRIDYTVICFVFKVKKKIIF